MSRHGHDDRTTAERMMDRRVSIGFSPSLPAQGHMPFPGHKPKILPTPPVKDRSRSEAARQAAERRALVLHFGSLAALRRAMEFGYEA